MGTFAAAGMTVKLAALQPIVYKPLCDSWKAILPSVCKRGVGGIMVDVTILVVCAVVAIVFVEEMALLINLIGSVLCMNIAFVMPVSCYWKLSKTKHSLPQKLVFIFLIAMGAFFAVF